MENEYGDAVVEIRMPGSKLFYAAKLGTSGADPEIEFRDHSSVRFSVTNAPHYYDAPSLDAKGVDGVGN